MKTEVLVTAFGEDRPGIVARLTEVFVKNQANLEESRMCILGGEFAAIMLVTLPKDSIAGLNRDLESLKSSHTIVAHTKETRALAPDRFKGHAPYKLKVRGADHEGIVHKVSSFLRDHSINIQEVETGVTPAPETGTPLFSMTATILVPDKITQKELRKSFSEIADAESVDIDIDSLVATAV